MMPPEKWQALLFVVFSLELISLRDPLSFTITSWCRRSRGSYALVLCLDVFIRELDSLTRK